MDYVRRRDRIIIKLPKVVDFYLATLIREENGIYYVKLDRGDYFSFKDKSLIVERGIDRICPELITVDRIYDYIRGIGDSENHINKPETESLIPKVEEVIVSEEEIKKGAIIDKKEDIEEEISEESDFLEDEVTEDLDSYDEEQESKNDEAIEEKETNSDEDMFDAPDEKIDESVTVEEKSEDNKEPVDKEVKTEKEEVEETSEGDEVDESVVLEEKPEEVKDLDTEEVDESVVLEEDEENPEDVKEKQSVIKSNLDDPDIMLMEDSNDTDAGDLHESIFSNYCMRSLILLEAARSFSKNDRLLIKVKGEDNKYYLATVTMNRKGMLHVISDKGEKYSLKPSSSLIMGIGQAKKYPYAITSSQIHKFLLVSFKVKKQKSEVTKKSDPLIPNKKQNNEPLVNVKRENKSAYPVKEKKEYVKPPKQFKSTTGYLSKMTSKEIDEMIGGNSDWEID